MSRSPGRHLDWGTATTLVNLLAVLVILAGIATFAVFAVPQLVGAERSYVVLSGSMQPTMEPGDVILVDAVDVESVEQGDIVSFRDRSGSVTTHRVVEVISDGDVQQFRTKGDNNEERDPYMVPGDAVIGTVPTVFGGHPLEIPHLGHALVLLSSRWAIFMLAIVPASLLIVSEVYDLAVAYRNTTGDPDEPITDGGEDPE